MIFKNITKKEFKKPSKKQLILDILSSLVLYFLVHAFFGASWAIMLIINNIEIESFEMFKESYLYFSKNNFIIIVFTMFLFYIIPNKIKCNKPKTMYEYLCNSISAFITLMSSLFWGYFLLFNKTSTTMTIFFAIATFLLNLVINKQLTIITINAGGFLFKFVRIHIMSIKIWWFINFL